MSSLVSPLSGSYSASPFGESEPGSSHHSDTPIKPTGSGRFQTDERDEGIVRLVKAQIREHGRLQEGWGILDDTEAFRDRSEILQGLWPLQWKVLDAQAITK